MPLSPENSKNHKENFSQIDESVERIARLVVDAAYTVHLKLTGKRLGFLINFNVAKIKDGIRRFVI